MITVPEQKPASFTNTESDFGTTVARSLWKRCADMQAYFNKAFPVGRIIFFHGGQINKDWGLITLPNSSVWQFCDGSIVSNGNSPMNGQPTPRFDNRMLRGSTGNMGVGGRDGFTLVHNHGGLTGYDEMVERSNTRTDQSAEDKTSYQNHAHTISTESWYIALNPHFVLIQAFMRIV